MDKQAKLQHKVKKAR